MYGVDANGDAYVHVKVYKQGRIFGEVVATSGVVRLRCRECRRWHAVWITQREVNHSLSEMPEAIPV